MNRIEFNHTGGFPLSTDILEQLQGNYQIFSAMSGFVGELGILVGCEVVGTKVMPGVVIIQGELLEFSGGTLSSDVIITEESETKIFENGDAKPTIFTRKATFGNGITSYLWADFYRVKTQKSLEDRIAFLELKTAPIANGGIVLPWRKPENEIPIGWKECIDFRGKTIVGWNPNDVDFSVLGAEIGEKKHLLSIDEMPMHSHKVSGQDNTALPTGSSANEIGNVEDYDASNAPITRATSVMGGNQAHNNLQPSRIALYIEPNFQ